MVTRRADDQPLPTPSDRPAIQDGVIADIERRKAVGIERYGNLLQTFNGRSSTRDLYEELQDATIYARQLLDEIATIKYAIGQLAAVAMNYAKDDPAVAGILRDARVQLVVEWSDQP